MDNLKIKATALSVILILILASAVLEVSAAKNSVRVDGAVEKMAKETPEDYQTVIISFEDGKKPKNIRRTIKNLGGEVVYDYSVISGAAVKIKGKDLGKLKDLSGIDRIEENSRMELFLSESAPLIGASYVSDNWGYDGSGVGICVLDTGVDYTNPYLSEAYIGGWDFVNEDDNPIDDDGHGTHVAGIIASNSDIYGGVAPGAKILAVKVCGVGVAGCLSADVIAGINWCVVNKDVYNISVITMSFGSLVKFTSSASCDSYSQAKAANNATANGIFVDAGSGNSGWVDGISYPACGSNVSAVGATYDADVGERFYSESGCSDEFTFADKITCFTNRGAGFVNSFLLAPGMLITSTQKLEGAGSNFTDAGGTSQSAPHVAGLAALMIQANRTLAPLQIRQIMKDTGVPIYDSATGLTFPRINSVAAVAAVMPGDMLFPIADFNENGNIDFWDFMNFTIAYNMNSSSSEWQSGKGDFDFDSDIDFWDFMKFTGFYGKTY